MATVNGNHYIYAACLVSLCLAVVPFLNGPVSRPSTPELQNTPPGQIATPTPVPDSILGTLCVMPFDDADRSGLREGGEDEIKLTVRVLSVPDELIVAQGEPAEKYAHPCYDLPPGHYIATVTGGDEWIPTLRDSVPADVRSWDVTFVAIPFYAADSTLPTPAEKWFQQNAWVPGALASGGFLIGLVVWREIQIKRGRPQPSKGVRAIIIGLIAAASYGLIASILTPLEQDSFAPAILSVPSFFLMFVVDGRNTLVIHGLSILFWFGTGAIVSCRVERVESIIAICIGIAVALALLSYLVLLGLFSNFPPI